MPSPPLSIVQSLSPRIAVLTSDDVVESCEANGCRGLEELLRPWEGGTERGEIMFHIFLGSELITAYSVHTLEHIDADYTPDLSTSIRQLRFGVPQPRGIDAPRRCDCGLN